MQFTIKSSFSLNKGRVSTYTANYDLQNLPVDAVLRTLDNLIKILNKGDNLNLNFINACDADLEQLDQWFQSRAITLL